jgi:hypothetical protein
MPERLHFSEKGQATHNASLLWGPLVLLWGLALLEHLV